MTLATRDRIRQQLRQACATGELKKVEALLRPDDTWYYRLVAGLCSDWTAGRRAPGLDPKVRLLMPEGAC